MDINKINYYELLYFILKFQNNIELIIYFYNYNPIDLPFYLTNKYLELINEYINKSKDNIINILFNPKIEYRYFCYNLLDNIRKYKLPDIYLNLDYETVLMEFRPLLHLEFIIKNTIRKIGNKWSHTIVCGNLNYDFIINICKDINNIKIIKLDYDNLTVKDCERLTKKIDFWNMFYGNKLLFYHEDSFVFKTNIDDFISWDYIGASWPIENNVNSHNVGNGGFSIRTKSVLCDIIKLRTLVNDPNDDNINEDVYFTKFMIQYNIGKLANVDEANKFSCEYFITDDAFGSHNFVSYNYKWKSLIYNNILKYY
jgi:hypothetical protein